VTPEVWRGLIEAVAPPLMGITTTAAAAAAATSRFYLVQED
jgi:hypothetical protein